MLCNFELTIQKLITAKLKTMTNLQNTVNQAIPVYFDEETFNEFILPHLWAGARGPSPNISQYKFFHYVLFVLYTGIQWKMLPIAQGRDGKPEIHYTNVWRKWAHWVERGSIAEIFYRSVKLLRERGALDLSVLHGDGSNTVAKKGGKVSATAATSTRTATSACRFLTIRAMSLHR